MVRREAALFECEFWRALLRRCQTTVQRRYAIWSDKRWEVKAGASGTGSTELRDSPGRGKRRSSFLVEL